VTGDPAMLQNTFQKSHGDLALCRPDSVGW
jgi:hypothetical protein